ncbi:MAG: 50S ribosomal protein L10 [Candidatus Binatia bacterium]|nr:50S ribosomal protein L10 [Candidatus Binatia bacterium]
MNVEAKAKAEVIEGLKDRLGRANIAIIAEPNGLNVAEVTGLRNKMREMEGEYKIAKNTLALRAFKESDFEPLHEMLVGQTALVFGYGDPVAVAKELVKFTKDNAEKLQIKGAILEGQLFAGEDVKQLAKLKTKDELRSQLLSVLTAPATQLVRLLSEPANQLARVIKARGDSGAPAD